MNYLSYTNLIFVTIAFFFDIRTYRIPNKLMIAGVLCGAVLQVISKGAAGILCFAGGAMLPLLTLFPLYMFRMIGAGDIKLLSLSGGFLSLAGSLKYMVFALVISGIFATTIIISSGSFIERMNYFTSYITSYLHGDRKTYIRYGNRPENFHLSVPVLICAVLAAGNVLPV